jgi:uncharacterized protein (DUF1800 family)
MLAKETPWAPFEPSAADPWDLRKVAHLHRRAGFGATWSELERDLKSGPAESVARLLQPGSPAPEQEQVVKALEGGIGNDVERLKAWWLYRMLFGPDPLREKLTLFWHGHFATSNRKVGDVRLMLEQNDLFRSHGLGRFSDLLTRIVGDGAMLVWLDGIGSKKERPNENFAREFLELFTLGIGHYEETDIRQAARAFTGWGGGANAAQGRQSPFRFNPAAFDDGAKKFLRQTGSWKPEDIVRIALEQPACALFLCRKLYRFYVSEVDEPTPALLEPLAAELRASDYSLRQVLMTIFCSRHFYDRATYRARIKSPVEFSVGLVRMLEIQPTDQMVVLPLAVACERQGQDLFYPPNVKGWDGGKTWINSTTVLERGNWATDLVWGNRDLGLKPYDPQAWARRNQVPRAKIVASLLDLLLQGDCPDQARDLFVARPSSERAGADGAPESLRKALQLMLHLPEFQLA